MNINTIYYLDEMVYFMMMALEDFKFLLRNTCLCARFGWVHDEIGVIQIHLVPILEDFMSLVVLEI